MDLLRFIPSLGAHLISKILGKIHRDMAQSLKPLISSDVDGFGAAGAAGDDGGRPLYLSNVNLWVNAAAQDGIANAIFSPLHFDAYHNFLCQCSGHEEVLLFPPRSRSYL